VNERDKNQVLATKHYVAWNIAIAFELIHFIREHFASNYTSVFGVHYDILGW